MSRPWVIDIETVPLGTTRARGCGVPDEWLELEPFVPPAPRRVPVSYRDPAKIAAKQRELDERYQVDRVEAKHKWFAQRVDAWKARALSPYTAEVVAIAMHPVQADAPTSDEDVAVRLTRKTCTERGLLLDLEQQLVKHQVSHLVHWSTYDPPVLREAMCRHDLELPHLQSLTGQSVRGRAFYPRCLDASVLTHARHANYSRGWGLKHIAKQLGWSDPAGVESSAVYDAWLAANHDGCAERAAVDVYLVLRILERERALCDVLDWARGAR